MSYNQFEDDQDEKKKNQVSPGEPKQLNVIRIRPDYDVLIEDDQDREYWTSARVFNLKYFWIQVALTLFNLGPVYIAYLMLSPGKFIQAFKNKQIDKRRLALIYAWNYYQSICIVLVFALFVIGTAKFELIGKSLVDYYHWTIICTIFITLYSLFISQKEMKNLKEKDIKRAVKFCCF